MISSREDIVNTLLRARIPSPLRREELFKLPILQRCSWVPPKEGETTTSIAPVLVLRAVGFRDSLGYDHFVWEYYGIEMEK